MFACLVELKRFIYGFQVCRTFFSIIQIKPEWIIITNQFDRNKRVTIFFCILSTNHNRFRFFLLWSIDVKLDGIGSWGIDLRKGDFCVFCWCWGGLKTTLEVAVNRPRKVWKGRLSCLSNVSRMLYILPLASLPHCRGGITSGSEMSLVCDYLGLRVYRIDAFYYTTNTTDMSKHPVDIL